MAKCKGCGKEIVWGKIWEDGGLTGKRVPLDPKPPVYELEPGGDGEDIAIKKNNKFYLVSHFATCSHANDFSGSKKK